MLYEKQEGVPRFEAFEYSPKRKAYVVLIPVINEGKRLHKELYRAYRNQVPDAADLVICDGGSTDGSINEKLLRNFRVNGVLVKKDSGRQGAQLRMGIWWALERGYRGIITVDGNNKDSIEDVGKFVRKLEEGFDFVQGSRFVKGGRAVRTPLMRLIAVRVLHAPVISLTAGYWFTDTTNAFRGYSETYLRDPRVQPLREVFQTYELLAYLSVRASQLGYRVCEIPVTRCYPKHGKTPTKISPLKGNGDLLKILFLNFLGAYRPGSRLLKG